MFALSSCGLGVVGESLVGGCSAQSPGAGGSGSLEPSQEDCATLTSLMFRSSADFYLLCVCQCQGVHVCGRFNHGCP